MKKLLLLIWLFISFPAWADEKQESTYDRVVRTKTLRCAYTVYPTFVEKDPNTGKLSGTSYEVVEEMGKQLGIKIEWGPEVGVDAAFEGLGRSFDANCTGYTAAPARTWAGDFTKPYMFIPYNLYVKADEARFKTFDDLNKPDVKIATMDGELMQLVRQVVFPAAAEYPFPAMASVADRFESVVAGKATAVPMDATIGADYLAKNPGKLKILGKPLQMSGCVIVIPHNEFGLKSMLDASIDSMTWTGILPGILKKHQKYEGTLYAPAIGYQGE